MKRAPERTRPANRANGRLRVQDRTGQAGDAPTMPTRGTAAQCHSEALRPVNEDSQE